VEDSAIEHGLLITTTHSTPDGYAGDEVVFAPALTSTDDELELIVARLAATMKDLS